LVAELDQPLRGLNVGWYNVRPDSGYFQLTPSTEERKDRNLLLHEPLQHLSRAGTHHPGVRLGLLHYA
jgi:hypothetical protein